MAVPKPVMTGLTWLTRQVLKYASAVDDQLAGPALVAADRALSQYVRRTITEAEAWKLCPEHGPLCVGPDCCCTDLHLSVSA